MMKTYLVRKHFKNEKKEEKAFGDDFQSAAEYYFKERQPFEYGKNGGRIELISEKQIWGCS